MFPSLSAQQQVVLAVLVLTAAVWIVGLARMVRRGFDEEWEAVEASGGQESRPVLLDTVPVQAGPSRESVELTEAEERAFASLVRDLSARGR
ncbi:hypothetical protein ACFV3R_16070 [Streptomyces sp. NPDC059740]|uniref:hypothetical protein n=1 Tax=Streptomyces sp. NPDC059740 TaxID=3346926 RepID=UPI00364D54CF